MTVPISDKIQVRVFHARYGCDTGCCGHIVELTMPDGEYREVFDFVHPYLERDEASRKAWARKHAEAIIRHKWPECVESIDWESMGIEVENNC